MDSDSDHIRPRRKNVNITDAKKRAHELERTILEMVAQAIPEVLKGLPGGLFIDDDSV